MREVSFEDLRNTVAYVKSCGKFPSERMVESAVAMLKGKARAEKQDLGEEVEDVLAQDLALKMMRSACPEKMDQYDSHFAEHVFEVIRNGSDPNARCVIGITHGCAEFLLWGRRYYFHF